MRGLLLTHASLLLIAATALLVVAVAALLLVHVVHAPARRRAVRRSEHVRELLLTALMGEPAEAADARASLARRRGRDLPVVEEQAFHMLLKIKGASRLSLIDVLLDKGASQRAVDRTTELSAVRRSQGAFQLGALGQPSTVAVLLPMLDDRSFLVRRMAVRALGMLGEPRAVPALLQVSGEEPRLSRDLAVALERIGPAAAPALRVELDRGLRRASYGGRHDELAAIGLGLVGDLQAVPLLCQALVRGRPGLRVAAAEALGAIGSPDAVPAMIAALDAPEEAVRTAAASGLGAIGHVDAVPALRAVLGGRDPELNRCAALALLRLGDSGSDVLGTSANPYAREAMALSGLRAGA